MEVVKSWTAPIPAQSAHRALLDFVNRGFEEDDECWDDPLPADCAAWIATVTQGRNVKINEELDVWSGEGGIAEMRFAEHGSYPSYEVTNMPVESGVLDPDPMKCWSVYELNNVLHIIVMQDQAGMGPQYCDLHYEMLML